MCRNNEKSADVGLNLDSSMMIQHADIWCSSLDLEHFTTVFFYYNIESDREKLM